MKNSLSAFLVASMALTTACASGPVTIKADLDPNDYASCPSGGSSRITGATFARQKNGNVESGAGRQVHLDPATLYSAAVFRAVVEQQTKDGFFTAEREAETVVPNTVMLKCRRTVQADGAGKFIFVNVPAGPYLLTSYLSWMKPHGEWVGIWNIKPLMVSADGKTLDFVLNGAPTTILDPPARPRQ